MDIHEYQAKEILADYGVPIPAGGLAYSPEQAAYRATEIGGEVWVVKAQIHSGARGKAGGIVVCKSEHEVSNAANELLGKKLVTHQTGPQGKVCHRLYIEAGCNIDREIYLAFVLDRENESVTVVASAEGGMEIEQLAVEKPESIIKIAVEPAVGMQPFQAREIAFALGLNKSQINQAVTTFLGCYRAMRDLDANMVEINPLVVTKEGNIIAVDAKMGFDDNALFRHGNIAELRDKSQEDSREMRAADRGLSYVGLDGNIGCIINGAGLAMASMDMIMHAGGEPANFLDVGAGRMAYLDEGPKDAPVLLMLHGNPTWSFYYRNLVKAFSDRYRVIVPDHLGCGRSDKPANYPYRLENHIENVGRLVDTLQLDDINLVVHDWGGGDRHGAGGFSAGAHEAFRRLQYRSLSLGFNSLQHQPMSDSRIWGALYSWV